MGRIDELWNRFWFRRVPATQIAVVRVALGVVALIWVATLLPDLQAFFTSTGIFPSHPSPRPPWALLQYADTYGAVLLVWGLSMAATVALVIGFWSRLASLAVWVFVLAWQLRAPDLVNGGDVLLRHLLLFLALSESGAGLSLDCARKRRSQTDGQVSIWPLRLIQIQISAMYLSTVGWKLRGSAWMDGTAVWDTVNIVSLTRVDLSSMLESITWLSPVATYSTLALELAIGLLVWFPRWRRPVLLGGVLLHVGIGVVLNAGLFSLIALAAYSAFLSRPAADSIVTAVVSRVHQISARRSVRQDAKHPPLPQVGLGGRTVQPVGADGRGEAAFSLIELLVVVIIVGILAGIAVPAFLSQRERGWQAQLTSDVRNSILDVEAEYVAAHGVYPADQAAFDAIGIEISDPAIALTYRVSPERDRFCVQGTDNRLPPDEAVAHYVSGNGVEYLADCPPL